MFLGVTLSEFGVQLCTALYLRCFYFTSCIYFTLCASEVSVKICIIIYFLLLKVFLLFSAGSCLCMPLK